MRRPLLIALAAAALAASTYLVWPGPADPSTHPAPPPATLEQAPRAAGAADLERAIAAFERRIREHTDALDYRFLGSLYLQRARVSGDAASYEQAEAALVRGLELFPTDPEGRALLATVRYATHDFAGALALARKILADDPAQLPALAIAADAQLELGAYEEAARAYAELAETYPDSAPILARLARLAFLRGEVGRAAELARQAQDSARQEGAFGTGLAWYAHLRAQLAFDAGEYLAADSLERAALAISPGYHVSLAGLARALAARGESDAATAAFERAIAVSPQPEYLAALGDLYLLRGDAARAERQFAAVDLVARLSGPERRLYDRQLALFYADHDRSIDAALRIALASLEARPDAYGHDVAAWALYRVGRFAEARAASDRARALGTLDARLLYHAGMISLALGELQRAREELAGALAIGPAFDPLQARAARAALASLEGDAR